MLEDLKNKLKEEGQVRFRVKVVPKSSKTEFVEMLGDLYKIRVAAVATKNKANKELINYLSKVMDVPKSNIEITSGSTSSQKTIRIQL